MPAKAPASDFENAIAAYVTGESIETAAARFHTSDKRLRAALSERQLLRDKRTRYRLVGEHAGATNRSKSNIPTDEIVRRYQAGESENALSDAYGVSRSVIRARLRLASVPIRSLTEANRMLVAGRTPAQRRRYIQAAQEAVRGRKQSLDEKRRRAQTRQERQLGVSPAELLMCEWLTPLVAPYACIPQYAVGPYNVDLAIDASPPVAVEIFGGGWHAYGTHRTRAPERYRYLLDRGWYLVIVWVDGRKWPLSRHTADYIAAFFQEASGDPSMRSQYRVIWGDGKDVPPSCLDFDNLTLIPSRRAANRARAAH